MCVSLTINSCHAVPPVAPACWAAMGNNWLVTRIRVAYTSDESGRDEIYVQAFPEPHGKFQISTAGGQHPRWGRGDGGSRREIFYESVNSKMMVASVKLGTDSVVASTPVELFPIPGRDALRIAYDVTSDGQRFLVRAAAEQARQPLHLINWPALLKKHAVGRR
jgi:hypothetical protein